MAFPLKFSRREAQVLDALLERPHGVSGLADAMGIKKSNLSRYLKKLEYCGAVVFRKKGTAKEFSIAPGIRARYSEVRRLFPTLRLGDVLAGYRPSALAFLGGKQVFRLADLGLPSASAKRLLSVFRRMGLVWMPKKGEYWLRAEARAVSGFCRDFLVFAYFERGRRDLGALDVVVLGLESARGPDVLFMSRRKVAVPGYWLTGLSAAGVYGLPLVLANRWYYCNFKPSLGDVVLGILSMLADSRNVAYAAALVVKNRLDPHLLLESKRRYSLTPELIRGFVDFVESRGRIPFAGLDSFDEVSRLLA